MIPNAQQPTGSLADALQRAFDFYNQRLFGGTLPQCVLLMHRNKRSTTADTGVAHELALNPDHVHARPIAETLSTLVHEMVHLQQEICGEPGRRGYHNREWADLMEKVGLITSTTGTPDGKRTGAKVSHYYPRGRALCRSNYRAIGVRLGAGLGGSFIPPVDENKKGGTRAKYACNGCEASVWGKEGLQIRCDACGQAMGYSI
jgi:predicted SprT family Zn-dependent metalloprotease